jgi:AraC family transcriptional regulator, alkane utilization regulator
MDVLSDVLKSVRLEGAVYLNAEFSAPWCVRGKYGLERARKRLPGAEHLVYFHFLTEGRCKVRLVDGGEVLDVGAGDLVLFPRDDRHLMGSDLHLAPLETDGMASVVDATDFYQMRFGGGGAVTRFVCGYLSCSLSVCRPLLQGLPRVLRIPIGDGQAAALVRDLLRVGVRESVGPRPGGDSVLAKVAELLFVAALRRYIESLPPGGKGWLAGVRDPHVGRALALLHEQPGKGWTVDELAREAALSRSALAERFTELVGEPPIQYLMRWRLALAARTLRSGEEAVSRVAERSGYESEAAFTRAFKREFGMPPTAWRKAAPK